MKKRLMQAVGILAMSGLLAGCTLSQKDHGLSGKNPTEISIWHYYNGAQAVAFEELVSEFNSTIGEKKGVVVTSESKGSIDELVAALTDSLTEKVGASKELPNVFACYLDTAVVFDQHDKLVNLDDYVSKEEKESFMDNYIEEGCFGKEDNWMLFPVAKSTELLMINKTDWEPFAAASGYTTDDLSTWEGLQKTAQSYYEYSGGKSFFGRDAFANYMVIGSVQLGDEILEVNEGKPTLHFEEDTARKLWDNYYVPYIKGYYKQVGRYRSDDIKLGEIISMVCSSSSAVYFPTEVTSEEKGTYNIDYMVLPVPNFEGTKRYAVQQGASMAVSKSTEQEEYASVIFLEWLTETEPNMKFAISSGYLPVKKEANSLNVFEDYLKKSGQSLEGIEKDTISASLKQIQESTMYTPKGFVGGADARSILNKTMSDIALENSSSVEAKVQSGSTREEAVEEYLSEDNFTKWYESTKKTLETYCTEQ